MSSPGIVDQPTGSRAQQSSVAGTRRVLRLTAILWAAAWIFTLVVDFAPDPDAAAAPWAIFAALATVSVSWAVLALAQSVPSWQFVACVAVTALVAIASVRLEGLPQATLLLTTWVNLGTITAALLLPRRRALVVIWLLPTLAFATLGTRLLWDDAPVDAYRSVLMSTAYAVCVGMAVWVGCRALYRAASLSDDEAARFHATLRAEAGAAAHAAEVSRISRLLHDTCINTLGAIRSGAGHRSPDDVRARCAADLNSVQAMADTERDLGANPPLDVVSRLSKSARLLGVELDVTVDGESLAHVDGRIWAAAEGAVAEAILNIAKHTPTRHAQLMLSSTAGGLRIVVKDDGPGWSGQFRHGGGIDRSIRDRVEGTGGTMSISSSPGAGTSVLLNWPADTVAPPVTLPPSVVGQDGGDETQTIVTGELRRVVIGSGLWILGYSVVVTAAFVGVTPFAPSLVALMILVSALVLVGRLRPTALSRWWDPLIAAGIAVVVVLPGNTGGCLAASPAAWGPDGAAVLALIACMLGRDWIAPAWAMFGFAAGLLLPLAVLADPVGDCVGGTLTVLIIEIGTVAVIFAVRVLLRRAVGEAVALRRRYSLMQAAMTDMAARDRARAARLRWAVTGAGDLMRSISSGEADPRDPVVMVRAGEMEAALRSLLILDADFGALGDMIAVAIVDALDAERRLEVRAGGPVPVATPAEADDVKALIDWAVLASPPGSLISIALFVEGDHGLMTIVLPAAVDLGDECPPVSGLAAELRSLDEEVLILARWGAGASAEMQPVDYNQPRPTSPLTPTQRTLSG